MEHAVETVTDLATWMILLMLVAAITTMIGKRVDNIARGHWHGYRCWKCAYTRSGKTLIT